MSRRLVIIAVVLLGVIVPSAVLGVLWYERERHFEVYTDAETIRQPADRATPRDILWRPAEALPEIIASIGATFDPHPNRHDSALVFVVGTVGQNTELFVTERSGTGWTTPRPIDATSSPADELAPALSSDGRRLVFVSDRGGGHGGYDLWASDRDDEHGWGEPVNLGPVVNSAYHEYGPACAPDGRTLFFASNRPPAAEAGAADRAWRTAQTDELATRQFDLFAATMTAAGVSSVHPLIDVNTDFHETTPAISPSGDFLYFASDRPGGEGAFDLYRSRRLDGRQHEPRNLGSSVNSTANELGPGLGLEGFRLYFASDRAPDAQVEYDLYVSTSREVFTDVEVFRSEVDWRTLLPLMVWIVLALLTLLLLWLLGRTLQSKFYRGLTLIAKCLVASLLVHACLLFFLTFWGVGSSLSEWIRDGSGLKVRISSPSIGSVAQQVRGSLTELQVTAAAAPSMQPAVQPAAAAPAAVAAALPARRSAVAPAPTAMPESADAPDESPQTPSPTVAVTRAAPNQLDAMDTPATPAPAQQAEQAAAIAAAAPDPRAKPAPRATSAAAAPTTQTPVAASTVSPADAAPAADVPSASEAPIESTTPAPVPDAMADATAPITPAVPDVPADRSADASESSVEVATKTVAHAQADASTSSVSNSAPAAPEITTFAAAAPAANTALPTAPPQSRDAAIKVLRVAAETDTLTAPLPTEQPGLALTIPDGSAPEPDNESSLTVAAEVSAVVGPRRAPAPVAGEGSREQTAATLTSTAARSGIETTTTAHAPAARSARPTLAQATGAPAPDAPPAAVDDLALSMPDGADGDDAERAETALAISASTATGSSQRTGDTTVATAPSAAVTTTTGRSQLATSGASVAMPAAADASPHATPDAMVGLELTALPLAAPALGEIRIPGNDPAPATGAPTGDTVTAIAAAAQRATLSPAAPARAQAAADLAPLLATPIPAAGSAPMLPTSADAEVASSRTAFQPPRLARELATLALRLPPIAPKMVGPYEQRRPEERTVILEEMGGSDETEEAVSLALDWLARHQHEDGRWHSYEFDEGCGGCTGPARADVDIALTGLSLLCFLAANHLPNEPGPYQQTVANGLEWLSSQQGDDGNFVSDESMYSHGIASIAMAEAYGMTGDETLRPRVEQAIAFIMNAANRTVGGWRYAPRQSGDTSVLGWQIMALSSAKRCGIDVPHEGFEIAHDWLALVESRSRPGLYAYQVNRKVTPAMTAEAMFVKQLLGTRSTEPSMPVSARYVLRHPPNWEEETNTYYWYYGTLALFQHQGGAWRRWNEVIKDELLSHQIQEGRAAGSWPNRSDRWARTGGRVYQTAICTLTLEVYYRYLPLFVREND